MIVNYNRKDWLYSNLWNSAYSSEDSGLYLLTSASFGFIDLHQLLLGSYTDYRVFPGRELVQNGKSGLLGAIPIMKDDKYILTRPVYIKCQFWFLKALLIFWILILWYIWFKEDCSDGVRKYGW